MATGSSDFVTNPLIQVMACNVHPFSKQDIIDGATELLDMRLRSTQSFLTQYGGVAIEHLDEEKAFVPLYYLTPEAWMAVLKAMPESTFCRFAFKLPEGKAGRTFPLYRDEKDSIQKDFLGSFYAFLHRRPFAQQVHKMDFPTWTKQYYLT